MNIRIGFGYDIHQLKEGNEFWLGGIKISHYKGASGHSDADVLIHAICDALLGAANMRDIGYHFPDTSPEFKGADSKILLAKVAELLKEKQYGIGNVDATICLEKPKISPYIKEMQIVLSTILKTEAENVSIKATTSEKMSFVGKEQGIKAYAVVLITKE